MSLRRFGRKVKTLAEKGPKNKPRKHVIECEIRGAFGTIQKYEWHYTKGFRRWI